MNSNQKSEPKPRVSNVPTLKAKRPKQEPKVDVIDLPELFGVDESLEVRNTPKKTILNPSKASKKKSQLQPS